MIVGSVRRILSIIIVVIAFAGILLAQEGSLHSRSLPYENAEAAALRSSRQAMQNDTVKKQAPQRRKIDFMADEAAPYNDNGDSIVYFVGNFAAHHNGAVISCDSAVRFNDTQWGFFGRLLINQDSIYIYGDSALYNGDDNIAEIFAPIVKVVDGDALLYTYNFRFNTADKIGRYEGGGVLVHDNDIMESVRGYYYVDNHEIICVESVEMHGADYDMKSDSVIYNTETNNARFFANSEIWNADGHYLSANEGDYIHAENLYKVTRDGYILTEEQEMWGDTMYYYRNNEHIVVRRNIQVDDFKNKMLAFGGYAEYWSDEDKAVLTDSPVVVNYDTSESDSVFLSADSMWLYTIDRYAQDRAQKAKADSIAAKNAALKRAAAQNNSPLNPNNVSNFASGEDRGNMPMRETLDSAGESSPRNNMANRANNNDKDTDTDTATANNKETTIAQDSITIDSLQTDSIAMDSIAADTLSPKERKALEAKLAKEAAKKAKEEAKKVKAAERKIKLDSIAAERQAKVTAMLEKLKAQELERMAKDSVRRALKRQKLQAKGKDLSLLDAQDSLAELRKKELLQIKGDTTTSADSLGVEEFAERTSSEQMPATDTTALDSIYRIVKAYRNVKMFRSDAQAICDSLVSNSTDSIIHMYIEPVMWNNGNQIAAEQVDVFTKNQQIERAEFLGTPIMVAEIDTTYYNQVAGKKMITYFRNNDIYRNDVDGNVQTIYFEQDTEGSLKVTEMAYIESASASFYIEEQQLVGITYRNDVPIKLYPLAQIPASQAMRLQNFKWVPERRPSREGIFDRAVRSSVREERKLRQRPLFDIVERMDRYKERLIMSGDWIDREDELTPELVEWRDSREP